MLINRQPAVEPTAGRCPMITCEQEQKHAHFQMACGSKGTSMSNQDNRVLVRKGARELSAEEATYVTGAASLATATKCSITAAGKQDGDPHEC